MGRRGWEDVKKHRGLTVKRGKGWLRGRGKASGVPESREGPRALRGFDAIHSASALLLKERTHLEVSFSCFDKRLKAAARAEGLIIP